VWEAAVHAAVKRIETKNRQKSGLSENAGHALEGFGSSALGDGMGSFHYGSRALEMFITTPMRLLIVDPIPVLLEGMAALLRRRDFQVTTATDSRHLPAIALTTPIETVVVDVAGREPDAWTDVRRIQESLPAARVVVMDAVVREYQLRRAMRQNLGGFIAKFDPVQNIAETLLSIRRSDFVVSASVLARGFSTTRANENGRGSTPGLHLLTQREVDVLRLIGDGLPMKDIAGRLRISECTLDNHKTRILKKLRMHRIVDLVRFAIGVGLAIVDESNCLPPITEHEPTAVSPPAPHRLASKAGARR
jgi:DNA-binding NarL/FixJ family response regulator